MAHGVGTMKWQNGQKYSGQFVKDKMEGIGEMTYFNGDKRAATFLDNKMHGESIRTTLAGKQFQEVWDND